MTRSYLITLGTSVRPSLTLEDAEVPPGLSHFCDQLNTSRHAPHRRPVEDVSTYAYVTPRTRLGSSR